MTTQNKGQQR